MTWVKVLLPALVKMPDWAKAVILMGALFLLLNQQTVKTDALLSYQRESRKTIDETSDKIKTLDQTNIVITTELRLLRERMDRMDGKIDILIRR